MTDGLVRRCMVCKTIELGKNALIPDGKYQLVNPQFSDGILSEECLIKEYGNQLTSEQLEAMLSKGDYYKSCRHHDCLVD
ncbi:MAG: hypothetical protein AABX29_07015 [Nanoarchaeota archaeon]